MPVLVAWSGKAYLRDGPSDFLSWGGGTFANFTMFFLPLRLCSIFWGVIAQPPSPGPRTCCVMTKFGYIYITHVVLIIIPSEFQVIISGSKEQQQKDSYQSEVPF